MVINKEIAINPHKDRLDFIVMDTKDMISNKRNAHIEEVFSGIIVNNWIKDRILVVIGVYGVLKYWNHNHKALNASFIAKLLDNLTEVVAFLYFPKHQFLFYTTDTKAML